MELREFTNGDWYEFAGAERDGREPLISQNDMIITDLPDVFTRLYDVVKLSATVIVDRYGITLHCCGIDSTNHHTDDADGWCIYLATNDVWQQVVGYDLGRFIAERMGTQEVWDDLIAAGFHTANFPEGVPQ